MKLASWLHVRDGKRMNGQWSGGAFRYEDRLPEGLGGRGIWQRLALGEADEAFRTAADKSTASLKVQVHP